MMHRVALALLLASGCASAGEAARDLLERMGEAMATREYDGVLVYMHDGRVETLRVVRSYENGLPMARVTALSGAPRIVESADAASQCTTPDGTVTTVHPDPTLQFSSAAPSLRAAPEAYYELRVAGDDRVAGLDAEIVEARPRDRMRFGMRVWIAQSTGMLLGSSRLRFDGRPLEQMMFSHIRVGPAHLAAESPVAAPMAPGARAANDSSVVAPTTLRGPSVRMPPGFELIGAGPGPRSESRHFLYSDGIANVSLYLDPAESDIAPPIGDVMRRGAIHVFERRGARTSAVVLGDVPAATIKAIAASLQLD